MKVLTLQQPHASAIFAGLKRYETRSWQTPYRGPLAIHAGARVDAEMMDYLLAHLPRARRVLDIHRPGYPLPTGVILGVVELVEIVPTESLPWDRHAWGEWGDFSENRLAWRVKRPRLFARPIPAKGRLGLWDVDL